MRTASKGIGGHQRPHRGETDTWLTPPHILEALGPFGLDPCCPEGMPWRTAATHYTPEDDGLVQPWHGLVWLNPPYGPETGKWLERLADHGSGIALVFARTETDQFFRQVWDRANAVLFLKGRLHFHRLDGTRASFNAGAPSVLVAYGAEASLRLAGCNIEGKYLAIREVAG
jgi:hypothetical protein